ncbi:TIGR03862 family flavoprotein [Entomomonas asaccharolytica]|uniref:TIGR03862 family flavoprotein n=1 Tax=Entomomonas asaccharolytica TaxID=2785331 RepID=A0A974RWA9_9GAMM|nr:TIGR03862 family flavoprotein [Entomomonas asaccharolytica]QQP84937.1 TIGR03862 family flavoprotein [Entomomonas asaccharolytica]
MTTATHQPTIAIIGAGPAGLIAAEIISQRGFTVQVFDRMPSVGRKFLLAGIGGLNITHSEPFNQFKQRYIPSDNLTPYLQQFGAEQLRAWCHGLGIETFVGSSGRIFPKEMKAAPLLRAWLKRLREQGVQFYTRHTWQGWNNQNNLIFSSPEGDKQLTAQATLLALGGASYPRLGTDGQWIRYLQDKQINCASWQASNCGFEVKPWSTFFKEKYAGSPVKQVAYSFTDTQGKQQQQLGELLISKYGVEGSAIYALSAPLRETITTQGSVTLYLDLFPQTSLAKLEQQLSKPQGSQSISNYLRKQINLKDIKMGLVRELAPQALQDLVQLPYLLKALPISLIKPRPIAEAISSAGGICFNEVNQSLMLKKLPSVFCAGEMLDWEAPTGGYLLTGCFATGYAAGLGIIDYLTAI